MIKEKITTFAILVGVSSGLFLTAFDSTVISVAVPNIVHNIGGASLFSWVFVLYTLAATTSIPIFGKLGDMYGRRRIYLIGLVIFMAGSILCGISNDIVALMFSRFIQGIGGGILTSNSFAIVGEIVAPKKRGKYQSVLGGVYGIASILGPLLGGYITDISSWRWNFYINIPIGILAIVLVWLFMLRTKRTAKSKPDYWGATTFILFLVPLLLCASMMNGQIVEGKPYLLYLVVLSLVFLVLFVMVEKYAEEPIIPLRCLKKEAFNLSVLSSFANGYLTFVLILYVPTYVQEVQDRSATESGGTLIALMLGLVAASILAGQLLEKRGAFKAVSVAGYLTVGAASYFFVAADASTSYYSVLLYMLTAGIGIGITMPVYSMYALNAFNPGQVGVITALIIFVRNIGGVVGTTVSGTFVSSSIEVEGFISEQWKIDYSVSINRIFLVCFIISVISLLCSLRFKNGHHKGRSVKAKKDESRATSV